ncbi:D-alanyl-D-alanine carboxypeptidase family protein [Salinarimonas soli]|uniref:serine-type D-Ala-D-Ala carboxypeptidase n=1 Tax=Salinarimonas soli TaxID=1638099 RepID=A0A5B2VEA1_9HYPH|nr:D-alanyl-D-alanine carboxypeptidase family protein [Salinarimonas soli]KAA2236760.1 D-alanyl-D-alanine carboxypeptidase [Salinarimonas soli]
MPFHSRTGGLRRAAAVLSLAAFGFATPAPAQPAFETAAPHAILIDYNTGTVLYEKAADQKVPPASLAKLMTEEVIFDQLAKGKVSLEDTFTVSQRAWREGGASSGGSTMFLPLNSRVSLGDLIKGIAIQSGNDATIVVAEGMAGSVEGFARMMNEQAKALGLKDSHFMNSHGLHDPAQHVTMRDMSKLATHIIREHPDHYKVFSQAEYTFNNIVQQNRNPLLAMGGGTDGLKTGYTKESGYGLVASAERDGRRLILAMMGMKSIAERKTESERLMEWGFRSFEQTVVLKDGEAAGEARVTGGAVSTVALVPKGPVTVTQPRGTDVKVTRNVAYQGPIEAPVKKGAPLATLQLTINGKPLREVPLYAAADVEQGPLWWRAVDMAGGYVSSGAGWVANEITTRVMSAWNGEPATTGSTAPAIPAPAPASPKL